MVIVIWVAIEELVKFKRLATGYLGQHQLQQLHSRKAEVGSHQEVMGHVPRQQCWTPGSSGVGTWEIPARICSRRVARGWQL